MNDMTAELTKEIERDLGLKLPSGTGPQTGMKVTKPSAITHTVQINAVIEELQMTIRILEEAKKRL